MPLKFIPPLSPHEEAIYLSLPKLNGSVVSPDYWPKHERSRGEREFLAWCERHERKDWPQWLNDWEIRYRLTHRTPAQAPGRQDADAAGMGQADAR